MCETKCCVSEGMVTRLFPSENFSQIFLNLCQSCLKSSSRDFFSNLFKAPLLALSFQLSPLFGLVPLHSSFLVAHLPLYRGQDEERVCWSSGLRGLEPFTLIPQPPPLSSTLLCILTRMLPARPGEEELRLVLPVVQI